MESIMARALESTLKYWLKSFSRYQFKLQGRIVQLSNICAHLLYRFSSEDPYYVQSIGPPFLYSAPYGVPNYGPNDAGKKFQNNKVPYSPLSLRIGCRYYYADSSHSRSSLLNIERDQ